MAYLLYGTSESSLIYIGELFAKASRSNKFLTPRERWFDGAKRFKRKALGLFRMKTVKSLEEMAHLLYETSIASSIEEGRKIVPSLNGARIAYGDCEEIAIEEIKNISGEKKYRIDAYSLGL